MALSRKEGKILRTKKEEQKPASAWSDKHERQYEHIKEGLLERGTDEAKAEEIAAKTVNKERARSGEAEVGSGGRTYDQLRNEAKAASRAARR